jgi:hypothetical protein
LEAVNTVLWDAKTTRGEVVTGSIIVRDGLSDDSVLVWGEIEFDRPYGSRA